MPLVVGGAAIAIIFLMALTLVTLYYLSHQAAQATINWPLVGHQISDAFIWFRNRNLEVLRDVVNIAHGVISWAIDMVYNGVQWIHDIFFGPWYATIVDLVHQMAGVRHWIDTWVNFHITDLINQLAGVRHWIDTFVNLNINALIFWKAVTQTLLDTWVIPNINALITTVNHVIGITIPTIQARLGVAEHNITVTLPAEIAQANTDIRGLRQTIVTTITAPRTGLLDRTGAIEQDLIRVMPWVTAIGLSIPAALNLAKLARNPCWCSQEGPLQDNGDLELATLLDLL